MRRAARGRGRARAARSGDDVVHGQRLGDDLPHRHSRVQRAVGVLEDHLEPAPDLPQLALGQRGEVAALEDDLARGRLLELEDAPAGGRLAAAGLPDQAQGLAAADGEAHAVHRLDHGRRAAEEPPPMGKCFTRFRTSRIGAPSVRRGTLAGASGGRPPSSAEVCAAATVDELAAARPGIARPRRRSAARRRSRGAGG